MSSRLNLALEVGAIALAVVAFLELREYFRTPVARDERPAPVHEHIEIKRTWDPTTPPQAFVENCRSEGLEFVAVYDSEYKAWLYECVRVRPKVSQPKGAR